MNLYNWTTNKPSMTSLQKWNLPQQEPPQNRFIYVKQDFFQTQPSLPQPTTSAVTSKKVLINPHFRKTVYVNPLFNNMQKIHVNPKILQLNAAKQLVAAQQPTPVPVKLESPIKEQRSRIISTKNKFIRIPCNTTPVQSKLERKKRISLHSKYKIIRISGNNYNTGATSSILKSNRNNSGIINKFKLDKRTPKISNSTISKSNHKRKYVYINRFLSMSVMAKNVLLKGNHNLRRSNFVKINGILYKKSPNSLKRESNTPSSPTLIKKNCLSSKYKIIRKSDANGEKTKVASPRKSLIKRYKIIRSKKQTAKISPSKLRKCNLPCPIYRKFGRCKRKENGTCFKLHNPDQIILCTRFLQGACHNDKCLLSHKVSLEKMPTCKYYLDGLCSKDNCPYLHVKISAKAEICRNFLSGFCKEGAKCDKRHQFLCPDYEKSKNCLKKRCPYPHGEMVRNLKVTNIVAKKCLIKSRKPKKSLNKQEQNDSEQCDKQGNNRYYDPEKDKANNENEQQICIETVSKTRPKLGELPAFIPLFKDIS